MKKKLRQKLLSILLIVTILATDFFILGSNLITYGNQMNNETNNPNVEFSAYFKNDAGDRVDSIEKSIKSENLKLYAEIAVKNEGYFNGAIELDDSNFNIKNEILPSNTMIESIEGNTIKLKQISHGETIEVELGIEPIISDKMTVDMMSKISIVKLNGSYTASKDSGIQYGREVCINFQVDQFAGAELETDIITNKVFSVNGINKRIVQLLVKSRLTDNQYPIEQTTLKVAIPELSGSAPEKVNVLAIGKLATNGEEEIGEENWTSENGILQININNNPDNNNEITWNKDAYDKLVVTFIYSEDVNAGFLNIITNSEIKVYNSGKTYNAEYTENENQELNNIIMAEPEITTEEMYKGQLYANINAKEKKDIPYNTQTTLIVTKTDVPDEIIVHEGPDAFVTEEGELAANTKYISTEINKEKMLKILGQDGNIVIKNGETTTVINKDTETNESGNIVIYYTNGAAELEITTGKPVNAGVLEIKHTKALTGEYSINQIKAIKEIKTMNYVERTTSKDIPMESSLEIKETVSKAELTVLSENNLSTTEKNKLKLGVTLITDNEKYDLYKNPIIKIQLPDIVESVVPTSLNKQYVDEFKINIDYENSAKIIVIKLTGEQIEYASSLTQAYIELDLNITVSKLAATQNGIIRMTYENGSESASQYYGGTVGQGIEEKEIGIVAPTGIINWFNVNSNESTSMGTEITQQIKGEDAGETFDFEVSVVNNTDSDMENVKIFGKLPTTGNEENTLKTVLKNIEDSNSTIYYTENAEATVDIDNELNGWTTNLNELTNATLYLIELGTLAEGDYYTTTVNVEMPEIIERKQQSYAQYTVIYDGGSVDSRGIYLSTSVIANLEIELTGQVGGQNINAGDYVKEGEVIKYTATVTNNTNQVLQDIELKAEVPEGTVLVEPVENYEYKAEIYYEEITDEEKIAEITSETISLPTGGSAKIEYEVRVKSDVTEGTEISNQAVAIYNNEVTSSNVLNNILQESNVRITIKKADDESIEIVAGGTVNYDIVVENMSDEVLKDLKIQLVTETFTITQMEIDGQYYHDEDIDRMLAISELAANGNIRFHIIGDIQNNIESHTISATVNDMNTDEIICRGNVLTEDFAYRDASITLSSSHDNAKIKMGDIVTYEIVVENIGNVGDYLVVKDIVPDYLRIQELYINDELKIQSIDEVNTETYVQSISNYRLDAIPANPGEKGKVKIVSEVKYLNVDLDGTVITNTASVLINSVEKDTAEVSHIISSAIVEEDLKNTIRGYVWVDANGNGQKDSGEVVLPEINVNLYDVLTNSYLTNAKTDSNGEYKIEKIENGKYIVIFEYNMEEYEPTTYCAEGIATAVNSRAQVQEIILNGQTVTVAGSEEINLQNNVTEDINIGLKEKEEVFDVETTKSISGFAWIDTNRNGQKDEGEKVLSGIKVKLYNNSTNNYVADDSGNVLQKTTNINGEYSFTNIDKGSYVVIFEYNTDEYESTTAITKEITINGNRIEVEAIEVENLQEDVTDINIGIVNKNNNSNDSKDDNTGDNNTGDDSTGDNNTGDDSTGDDNTGDDSTGDDNTGNDNTGNDNTGNDNTGNDNTGNDNTGDDNTGDDNTGDDNTGDDNTGEQESYKSVNGLAWLDSNINGQKDSDELPLAGIKVILYNVSTKQYITDNNGKVIEITTDSNGKYTFNNISEGSYIILFEYDTEKYELATQNSNIVLKKISINEQERTFAVTNIIYVKDNIANINIGLREKLIFDLELNKYISRIVVQNSQQTKTYDYKNETLAKVEIHRKQIQGSLVVLEYTIKVKNNGEMAGYAKNIVDYLPKGLTFSSELNTDWYLSGDYLYTKSLENVEIEPGEEKEIKLTLTKTMTSENVGLINNRAEIYQDYNNYGNVDIDSTTNNQTQGEDDISSADVIIGISTGGNIIAYIILVIINIVLVGIAIRIMIKNDIIKISIKRERR